MLQVHEPRAIRLTLRLVAGAVALGLTASCAAQGLAFRQDKRVDIVAPRDRAEVSLPFEVRWTVRDFDVEGPGSGSFGLLIDRAPPAPGRTLESMVDDEPGCLPAEGCPDADYLAERGIFKTKRTSHVVERLRDVGVEGRRERHEVTIVLLDRAGRRLGESAFSVEFEVDRDEVG